MVRKLVCGVAINDSDYVTSNCPYYKRWLNMIRRCYSGKEHYENCEVCDEWLVFSNFKYWMENQDWEGKELDKDILFPGNATYSPDACVFVSKLLNRVLINPDSSSDTLPGVSYHLRDGIYYSKIRKYGKIVSLGSFKTEKEAHDKYVSEKINYLKEIASDQPNNIKEGIYRHIEVISNG